MVKYITTQLSPKELVNFFNCKPIEDAVSLKIKKSISIRKPFLTRKETVQLFDINLNYTKLLEQKEILDSLKIDRRKYFKEFDFLNLLFQ